MINQLVRTSWYFCIQEEIFEQKFVSDVLKGKPPKQYGSKTSLSVCVFVLSYKGFIGTLCELPQIFYLSASPEPTLQHTSTKYRESCTSKLGP